MCPLDFLFILLECHWIRSPYPLYSPVFFFMMIFYLDMRNCSLTQNPWEHIEYVLFLPLLCFLLLDMKIAWSLFLFWLA